MCEYMVSYSGYTTHHVVGLSLDKARGEHIGGCRGT